MVSLNGPFKDQQKTIDIVKYLTIDNTFGSEQRQNNTMLIRKYKLTYFKTLFKHPFCNKTQQ